MSIKWAKKLRIIGFNKSVGYSFIGKAWLLIGGLATSFLIATQFTPELQGYYYAFNSLLTLTVFAELGLSSIIVNFVSHECLNLDISEYKKINGNENSISRLVSICHFSIRWFTAAALLITIILIVIGSAFWSDGNYSSIDWKLPWVALSIATGSTLLITPITSALEGCNQLNNLYKFRIIQYIVMSASCWLAILMGAELWTASISVMSGLLTLVLLSWTKYEQLIRTLFLNKPKLECINWRKDIFPMQWRIALSWIGGYFTFALFVPVLFRFHSPVLAGQMGMTWAFVGALMSISAAWIAPHSPNLGLMVASKNYSELDKKFKNIFIVNTALMVLGSISLVLANALLNYINPSLGTRLLPIEITVIFLIGTVIYTMGLPIATYLRAHKKEPLTMMSIIGGVVNGIMVIILGSIFGAVGVAIAYTLCTLVTMPFLINIMNKKRREWH